jgi:RND family efflux transporter MFP subunit
MKPFRANRPQPLPATITMTRLQRSLISIAALLVLSACQKPAPAPAPQPDAAAASVLIAPQDLVTLQPSSSSTGPAITGSIQPQRRADLRSEVPSVVMQVLKENGELVRKGDLLVRLDDTAIRDSLQSAEEAVRVAGQTLDQNERQFQRQKTLRESGMTSTQQLEDAESRRNAAQSDLASAKARAAQARQQLQYTRVTAPFDGVVSERKVSPGDTAMIGKELVKVLDPTSMRFEGLISADSVALVKAGQPVLFRISGYTDQVFEGTVKRVNPAANANTRQLEVLVEFANGRQPQLSGLYAEGTVASNAVEALMLPASALVQEGDKSFAWRARAGVLNKIALELGPRDARTGNNMVRSGLASGDTLIRNPTSSLKDGQKYQTAPATTPQPKASAAASAASAAK